MVRRTTIDDQVFERIVSVLFPCVWESEMTSLRRTQVRIVSLSVL